LRWLYGAAIEWTPRMVVLAEDADEQERRGFTPEKLAESSRRIAREHQMPIDTRLRERVPGSGAACRAVVAAREHGRAHQARALLRELRVRNFRGDLIDREETIAGAAAATGIDEGELDGWIADDGTAAALQADKQAARKPRPAARVLDEKLANWSGGRRYTCPSYEITRIEDGVTIAVPGFQPFAVYNTILANLVPGLERRELPQDVGEVLDWSAIPIATQEVAVMCDIEFDEARERLGRVATQDPVGADGFWTRTE
jgi:hypothetical protein